MSIKPEFIHNNPWVDLFQNNPQLNLFYVLNRGDLAQIGIGKVQAENITLAIANGKIPLNFVTYSDFVNWCSSKFNTLSTCTKKRIARYEG